MAVLFRMKKPGADEYRITYHYLVVDFDIPRLDRSTARQIEGAIKRKLTVEPEMYGLPLRGILAGCWKLRVGDWRIIYQILGGEVRILIIENRRDVYQRVLSRLNK